MAEPRDNLLLQSTRLNLSGKRDLNLSGKRGIKASQYWANPTDTPTMDVEEFLDLYFEYDEKSILTKTLNEIGMVLIEAHPFLIIASKNKLIHQLVNFPAVYHKLYICAYKHSEFMKKIKR